MAIKSISFAKIKNEEILLVFGTFCWRRRRINYFWIDLGCCRLCGGFGGVQIGLLIHHFDQISTIDKQQTKREFFVLLQIFDHFFVNDHFLFVGKSLPLAFVNGDIDL